MVARLGAALAAGQFSIAAFVGLPVVATEPDGPHAKIYRDIAAKVLEQIKGGAASGRATPKIVIEA